MPVSFGRSLLSSLQRRHARRLGRLLVVTGARQVGKTTLVRHAWPDHTYIALDDPVAAAEWARLPATAWIERYPRAILDEVQKAPSLVHTVKAAHDASPDTRYVLLGSSQILLLSRISETLAGRASVHDLWPLTLPELATSSADEVPGESRLVRWLRTRDDAVLHGVPAADPSFPGAAARFERYLERGGMPAIHADDLDETEVRDWLLAYRRTYLERDVVDLAAARDLEPFTRAQAAIAERTGTLVNFSDLARTASISPDAARRFVRYLEHSYQVFQLPPWSRNPEKRLAKTPKLHFVDPGVHRAVTRRWGEPTGPAFESAVVSEILKQVRTAGLDVEPFHLRTLDGREVDLLLALEDGYVAFEVKLSPTAAGPDARHLRGLSEILDREVLGSFVVHRGHALRDLDDGILGIPAAWLLSPPD